MKVLMVIDDISKLGGSEEFCRVLSKSLNNSGVDVEIATKTNSRENEGIKLHNIPVIKNKYFRKSLFDYYNPFFISKIKEIIKDNNIDVVHFHNAYGIGSWSIKSVSKICKTVLTIHDLWPIKYSSKFYYINYLHILLNRISLNETTLISPTRYIADKLQHHRFRKIEIIRNLNQFSNNRKNKQQNNPPRFLYIGRLTRDKGIDTLLNVFKKYPSLRLTIVGDGPLRDYVNNFAKDSLNIDPVGFKENIENYYRTHDVLLLPSRRIDENQPLSILEGYSFGLPVIASNIGGIPEIVENSVTGLLHKWDSKEEIEKHIEYFVNNPEEISRMGQNAKKKIQIEFNKDDIINKYLEIYRQTGVEAFND